MSHGRVNICSLVPCPWMQVHARVILTGWTTVDGHSCVGCPYKFGRIAHGHVTRPWQFIGSRVGETFLIYFHKAVSHGRVASRGMCTSYGMPCA
ncbi:hypothetical protein GOBAR_AA10634 [Gossypium barbadense]|uniref:Uncharacterized protein n=1 Tax=Gossypium barbadense TaxID=3634 RepID=A0A2P5Y385_GOSBA|nr:hypothetical protein GOBAR_AA10634 [Gossypium barbadense]